MRPTTGGQPACSWPLENIWEDDMGFLSALTRRRFLQGVAAGAAAASTRSGLILPARAATKVPPGKKLFNDVKLKYFQDSNWLHAALWCSPLIEKEAGVGIESREQYDG